MSIIITVTSHYKSEFEVVYDELAEQVWFKTRSLGKEIGLMLDKETVVCLRDSLNDMIGCFDESH